MVTPGQTQLRRIRDGLGQRELGTSARPRNPWDTDARARWLFGRQSAAAVAARLAPAATGTDTGGSIRQPAAVLRHHRHQAHLRPGARATA
jgi:aspartyl-tRNA(Asn)/glutamyl-tRNA(Gln) amidotransferase subunit A